MLSRNNVEKLKEEVLRDGLLFSEVSLPVSAETIALDKILNSDAASIDYDQIDLIWFSCSKLIKYILQNSNACWDAMVTPDRVIDTDMEISF